MGKKILFFSFIVILALIGGFSFFMQWRGSALLQTRIEKELSKKFGGTARAIEVRFVVDWPVKLLVDHLTIERPQKDFSFDVRSATFSLGLSDIFFDRMKFKPFLSATFVDPKITFHMKPSGPTQPGNGPKNWPSGPESLIQSIPLLGDVATSVEIKNGLFELYRDQVLLFTTAETNLKLSLESVRSDLNLEIAARFTPAHEAFDDAIPIKLDSKIKWKNDKIELLQNDLKILSLTTKFSASYQTKTDAYDIHVKALNENLQSSPTTDASFPIRDWSGKLGFELNVAGLWGQPYVMDGFLSLKDYQSYVQWSYQDIKIFGHLKGTLDARFQGGQKFQVKNLSWNIDATDLSIFYGRFFHKPNGFKFLSEGFGETLKEFYLKSAKVNFLNLEWSGQGFMSPEGISHFAFTVPAFNLNGLEGFVPILGSKPMTGTAEFRGEIVNNANDARYSQIYLRPLKVQNLSAELNYRSKTLALYGPISGNFSVDVQGPWDHQNFWQSPMIVTGQVRADLPQIFLRTSPSAAAGVTTATTGFAFFPDSKLINNMKLNANITTEEFEIDQLNFKGLALKTQLNKGTLTADGEIQNAFGGQIILKKAAIPLTEKNPSVSWSSSFSRVDLAKFLENVFPQWKNLAFGAMSGEVNSVSHLPSAADFYKSIRAQGRLNVKDGLMNTIPFDQMTKNILSEAPGAGNHKPMYGNPERMQMDGQFNIDNNQIRLNHLQAVTAKHEEFYFDGALDFQSKINLTGTAVLTEAPVTMEYFQKHKDARNRLVVPVTVAGSILKPDLRLAVPQKSVARQLASDNKRPQVPVRKKTLAPVKNRLPRQR